MIISYTYYIVMSVDHFFHNTNSFILSFSVYHFYKLMVWWVMERWRDYLVMLGLLRKCLKIQLILYLVICGLFSILNYIIYLRYKISLLLNNISYRCLSNLKISIWLKDYRCRNCLKIFLKYFRINHFWNYYLFKFSELINFKKSFKNILPKWLGKNMSKYRMHP